MVLTCCRNVVDRVDPGYRTELFVGMYWIDVSYNKDDCESPKSRSK